MIYAGVLVVLARAGAQRRGLRLGGLSGCPIVLCGCASAAAAVFASRDIAPAITGVCGAIVCAYVDARTGYIFNELTAAIAVAGVVLACGDGTVLPALSGAAATGTAFILLYVVTRRRGIGLGDVKLAAALGMCFGVANGAVVVGAAFVIGASYGIVIVLREGISPDRSVPFAPFLAAGCAVAVVAGTRMAIL
ncbi:MAG: prepilin peptidase [Candidatus Velthaea sp.]